MGWTRRHSNFNNTTVQKFLLAEGQGADIAPKSTLSTQYQVPSHTQCFTLSEGAILRATIQRKHWETKINFNNTNVQKFLLDEGQGADISPNRCFRHNIRPSPIPSAKRCRREQSWRAKIQRKHWETISTGCLCPYRLWRDSNCCHLSPSARDQRHHLAQCRAEVKRNKTKTTYYRAYRYSNKLYWNGEILSIGKSERTMCLCPSRPSTAPWHDPGRCHSSRERRQRDSFRCRVSSKVVRCASADTVAYFHRAAVKELKVRTGFKVLNS